MHIASLLRKTYLWIVLLPYAISYLGAASNQLVLIANHDSFPVLMRDVTAAKIMPFGFDEGGHVLMTKDTHLNALGDIFDFHDGWISIGDMLIDAGGKLETPFYWIWMTLVLRALIERNTETSTSERDLGAWNENSWRI